MKLFFRNNGLRDPLEVTLAIHRYKTCWEAHGAAILKAFDKHTGLNFKQGRITVRATEDETSKAGTRHSPMTLSVAYKTEEEVTAVLIHELSHRLLIGNNIEPSDKNWHYHAHRHIDLFLYDVWRDVLGKSAAGRLLLEERTNLHERYRKAWDSTMSMPYEQRQDRLKKLIGAGGKDTGKTHPGKLVISTH